MTNKANLTDAFAKIFFWGTLISFLGTLPPSTLNISAMQISIGEGIQKAMYFSFGTIFSEIIFICLALYGINWMEKQKNLVKWLEWFTFIVVLVLAAGSFIAAARPHTTENVILDNHISRFILGMMMSAVTPMHLPFWFGWSAVFFTKKILKPGKANYFTYILGAAIGTFSANCIFIYGGKIIVERLNSNQQVMNFIIGIIFMITAIIQLVKIWLLKKRGNVRNPGK